MNKLNWIKSVKEQRNIETGELTGYLVNNNLFVPIAEGNRHYEDVKEWLKNNTPEPAFDLEDYKKWKKQQIKQAFQNSFNNGYTCSNGITMDCKLEDIDKLDKGLRLAQKLNQAQMVVRDFYNQEHELIIDEVDNMLTELGINWQTQWQKKIQLQKQVDEAQTIEEILNINW